MLAWSPPSAQSGAAAPRFPCHLQLGVQQLRQRTCDAWKACRNRTAILLLRGFLNSEHQYWVYNLTKNSSKCYNAYVGMIRMICMVCVFQLFSLGAWLCDQRARFGWGDALQTRPAGHKCGALKARRTKNKNNKNKTSKRRTRSRHLKGSRVAKSANANLLLLALPALAQTSGSNTNGEKQKYDANIQNLWGPGCMPSSSAHDSYMSPSIAHLKAVQENACEFKKLLATVRIAWSEARIYARYQSIASVPPSPE